jgi:hypothetical protein
MANHACNQDANESSSTPSTALRFQCSPMGDDTSRRHGGGKRPVAELACDEDLAAEGESEEKSGKGAAAVGNGDGGGGSVVTGAGARTSSIGGAGAGAGAGIGGEAAMGPRGPELRKRRRPTRGASDPASQQPPAAGGTRMWLFRFFRVAATGPSLARALVKGRWPTATGPDAMEFSLGSPAAAPWFARTPSLASVVRCAACRAVRPQMARVAPRPRRRLLPGPASCRR